MITVLKLTLANMRQKRFRTLLIILSIVLSVALMYTVLSLSSQTTNIFEHKIRKEVGNSQIMLLPGENSSEQYIPELNFDGIPGMEFQIPVLTAFGYTELEEEMIPIQFTGMSSEDYDTIYNLKFTQMISDRIEDYHVFIGNETAKVYQLSLGDDLEVKINNESHSFTIVGIIEDNNNLGYDLGRLELVASKDTLSELLNVINKVNGYYIKKDSQIELKSLIAKLEKEFPDYQVKDVTDLSDYKQMMQMIVTSLFLMVSAVVIVSAFIIFSSFKIIAIDRMPLMGTLRSIGATKTMTTRTLLMEAAFYGLAGGILGNGLGIVILAATIKMMFQNFGITVEAISYVHINYMLMALCIGLFMAIGSAMAPIIKMSNRSIRSIIFSEIQNEKHNSIYKAIIGIALVIVAFIMFNIAPVDIALVLNILGMLMVIIGSSMMIPMISNILTNILVFIMKPIFRERLDIITSNLKNDRTIMNNILLLAMGLGVILMINNFSTTVGNAVSNVYRSGKADAIAFYDLEDSFIDKVKTVEGVDHVYTHKQVSNLTANNGKIELMFVAGIDGQGYTEYAWNEFGKYLTDDLMVKFTDKRSAILTKFIAGKYDLKIGDTLDIDFNGTIVPYEVISIVPSIMNNGNVTYIYEDFLTQDSGVKNSQIMYLNIKDNYDIKKVLQDIKELMPYSILPIQTLEEMQDLNMKQNNSIFILMKAVSIIAMFIGVVGILNNFTISFLSRRKLMATMRSLGLSKRSTRNNMLLEAFICGLLGTSCGLLLGTILIKAMCFVVEAMGIPSEVMFYSMKDYIFVLISGVVLSQASAIFPAISISKENIVSGLKYE